MAPRRVGDLVERLVPGDRARTVPLPFGPTRRSGVRRRSVVIRALDVAIDLRAEEAARERMLGVAGDAHRAPVLDGDEHRAGVGAVVRTGAAHDAIARAQRVRTDGDVIVAEGQSSHGRRRVVRGLSSGSRERT